ncbi:MAG: hypothetical protein JW762_12790 [Dehalococcoidales bacterium]|nr:hypothetical protein [Dehalococcoidales bacterium]
MKKSFNNKLFFMTIIGIGILIGVLSGTGIAYASVVNHYLSVGTSTYTSYFDESIWSGEEFYFQNNQRITMSADKSDVTFVTAGYPYGSTCYLNGDSNDPTGIKYGPLFIWDEYGYNSQVFYNFFCWPIDGYDYYSSTYWYYGDMDSTNNSVLSQQNILNGSSPIAQEYSSYITQ